MAHTGEPTPGPWRYGPNLAQPVGVYWIQASDGEDITDAVQGEENAKLIAQAPVLMEALANAHVCLGRILDSGVPGPAFELATTGQDDAKAAIEAAS
jgi:hypothetical protein